MANVDRKLRIRVDELSQWRDFRTQRRFAFVATAVTVKLNVSQMGFQPRERFHRSQCGFPVAGNAKVVGVDVNGMWQVNCIRGLSNRLNDLSRSRLESIDGLVEIACVPGSLLFPKFHAAWIDDFRRV